MPVPAQYAIFPVINATLNGASTILLLTGHWLISRRRIAQHRLVMLTAFATSTLFLISYVLLAIAIVPLVIVTLARALRERFDKHRAIARWTFPLWLYVSVTGVLVYFMLYKWFA